MQSIKFFSICLFGFSAVLFGQDSGNNVRFHTSLGDIDVTLRPDAAPLTVTNFQTYLNQGTYVNTVFHRSVPGFVIQGGGYQLQGNPPPRLAAQNAPVKGEFKLSNTRGTIAMALSGTSSGTDPNSGTDQWFFNLVDNSSSLDAQNFTVFGQIANDAGLAVMDAIAALPVVNAGSPFDQLPVINYKNGFLTAANLVVVSSIVPIAPAVTTGGFANAASYGNGSAGISPGELLTVFGTNLGPAQLTTLGLDNNGSVTTSLAGTRVLFDGTPGPMIYTSSGQISVVVPFNVAGKSSVAVMVEYLGTQTASVQLPVVAATPSIFTLNASGTGDSATIIANTTSVISASNPARPGDILSLYGQGQGVMAPALPDGAIVGTTLPIAVPTLVLIDGAAVTPSYRGGAPGIVNGVLQVNFQVPAGLAPGTHRIQLQIGGATSPVGVNLQTR